MTDRPRLRGDLLAERSDGVVEMMPPDGERVLQLFEVEAAVACGMDGTRDTAALVVWAKMELGLATSEAEIAAVVAALAGAGCLAHGDEVYPGSSPFETLPPQRAPARFEVAEPMSAEIPIEVVELPEPGPGFEAKYGDEFDEDPDDREPPTAIMSIPADFVDEEPTPSTPPAPEAVARAPEAVARAPEVIAPVVPPRRDTPRGYAAAAMQHQVRAPAPEHQTKIVPADMLATLTDASSRPANAPSTAAGPPSRPADAPSRPAGTPSATAGGLSRPASAPSAAAGAPSATAGAPSRPAGAPSATAGAPSAPANAWSRPANDSSKPPDAATRVAKVPGWPMDVPMHRDEVMPDGPTLRTTADELRTEGPTVRVRPDALPSDGPTTPITAPGVKAPALPRAPTPVAQPHTVARTRTPVPRPQSPSPAPPPAASPPPAAAPPQITFAQRGTIRPDSHLSDDWATLPPEPVTTQREPQPALLHRASRAPTPVPTAMMPSVGRLPALSRTLQPEPIDTPTLPAEFDGVEDAATLPPENADGLYHRTAHGIQAEPSTGRTIPVEDDQINAPGDTLGGMVAPRNCARCGTDLLAGVRFCMNCGMPIAEMMFPVEPPEPPELEPPPQPEPPPAQKPATPRSFEAPAMRTPLAIAAQPRAGSQPVAVPRSVSQPGAPSPAEVERVPAGPAGTPAGHAPMPTKRGSRVVPVLIAVFILALLGGAAFVYLQYFAD